MIFPIQSAPLLDIDKTWIAQTKRSSAKRLEEDRWK
jgi:hypothetical protein